MKFQTIYANTTVIDSTVDFFIVTDHMSDANFISQSQSLNDCKKYFGKNTIIDLFSNQGLKFKDYFFIFDHYLNFEDFDGYFYPNYLLDTAIHYQKLNQKFFPNYTNDFTKKTHSVNCITNKVRPARLLVSCWFANNQVDKLLHSQSWTSTDNHAMSLLDELLQIGDLIDWTHEFGPAVKMLEQQWIDSQHIDASQLLNNSTFGDNFFKSTLNQIYKSTAISVVLEPVFWEHGSIATEKYMQAVYGGTIPLVNGYKIYDSFTTLGFDTFSDIIDTSSQYERNPILRIWNMLESNKHVFSQWQDIISDPHVQNRIDSNLILLKNPENIFKNSIKLNSKQSFNKMLSFRKNLDIKKSSKSELKNFLGHLSCGFQYLDLLDIPDKLNK
jgi:hypothetical protein